MRTNKFLLPFWYVIGLLAALITDGLADHEGQSENIWRSPNRLTPEQLERVKDNKTIYSKLPYADQLYFAQSSFGQLSKLCDWVIVGKVVDVQASKEGMEHVRLSLNIETNLFGKMDDTSITLPFVLRERNRPSVETGDRLLVFLAKKTVDLSKHDVTAFYFDKAVMKREGDESPFVIEDSRGAININSASAEHSYLMAAEGYIRVLRRGGKDPETYYTLLRQLVLSPVPRIKDDARFDLLRLLWTVPSFDLNRVLEDQNIDEGIKDYVRLILMPSRQPQKTP